MDSPVRDYLIATMGKCGMSILTVVNALITCSGMEMSVKIFPCAMVEESLMLPIDVSAKTVNSGMDKDVLTPVVLVDKFGMEPNVSVLLGETSMVLYVLNVSMAKSGMPKVRCVSVQQVMSGQASLARKPIIVQEIEFGIQNYNIVSAQTESIGMEEVVLFSQFVLVEEYGI